jgi:flagellar hook-basal body complex protein FliE
MNSVNPLASSSILPPPALDKSAVQSGGESFKDCLLSSIQEVNSMQQAADQAVEKLATGGDVDPAEVLHAVQKANVAFQMLMQMRNKIVSAYQDIQNIRV